MLAADCFDYPVGVSSPGIIPDNQMTASSTPLGPGAKKDGCFRRLLLHIPLLITEVTEPTTDVCTIPEAMVGALQSLTATATGCKSTLQE